MQWQVGKRYGYQDVGNPSASGVHPAVAVTPTCPCCGAVPDARKDAFFPACVDTCFNASLGPYCLGCAKCPTHCECATRKLAPLAPTLSAVGALLVATQQQQQRHRAQMPNGHAKGRRPPRSRDVSRT